MRDRILKLEDEWRSSLPFIHLYNLKSLMPKTFHKQSRAAAQFKNLADNVKNIKGNSVNLVIMTGVKGTISKITS